MQWSTEELKDDEQPELGQDSNVIQTLIVRPPAPFWRHSMSTAGTSKARAGEQMRSHAHRQSLQFILGPRKLPRRLSQLLVRSFPPLPHSLCIVASQICSSNTLCAPLPEQSYKCNATFSRAMMSGEVENYQQDCGMHTVAMTKIPNS